MSFSPTKAFLYAWLQNPEVLDFQGTDQELIEKYIYKSVDHSINRELASRFGAITTQVRWFPTESGWMIIDKHTKRMLHKGLKNENEVADLCRKHNYFK